MDNYKNYNSDEKDFIQNKKRNPRIEKLIIAAFKEIQTSEWGKNQSLDISTMVDEERKYKTELANVLKVKCKRELEDIKTYSIIKPKSQGNNSEYDYFPVKDREKEFNKSFEDFNNCKQKFEDLKDGSETLKEIHMNIFKNSLDFCIDDCENLLHNLNVQETKLRNCIDGCVKFSKYNLLAANFNLKLKFAYDLEEIIKI